MGFEVKETLKVEMCKSQCKFRIRRAISIQEKNQYIIFVIPFGKYLESAHVWHSVQELPITIKFEDNDTEPNLLLCFYQVYIREARIRKSITLKRSFQFLTDNLIEFFCEGQMVEKKQLRESMTTVIKLLIINDNKRFVITTNASIEIYCLMPY